MTKDAVGFKPTSVNVQGLTALINNLGRDCTPEQFMREFVQNGLEACQRTGLPDRRVVVDYNHGIHERSGMFKMSFTDNGDGMSLTQMHNLLNSISSSGGSGNTYENYGVGAKISSLTRNHFGVQYESWQAGVGNTIIIRYNPKYDVFGIQGFPDADGNIVYHRPIPDNQRPAEIQTHGTRVTLFGNALDQDTMAPPWGVSGTKSSWLYAYLNRRYFQLPAGIAVDVRQGYDQDPKDSQRHHLRRLEGFEDSLIAQAINHGVVHLKDAKAHWFVLKAESAIKGQSGLINQGELFNLEVDRTDRLTHFGILLGRERVVILIEPQEASQNIARTHLKRPDGSEFSWPRWQDEFRTQLPVEIQAYLESLLSKRNIASSSKTIQNRLMSLRPLYDLSGFSPLQVQAPTALVQDEEPLPLDALQEAQSNEAMASSPDEAQLQDLPATPPHALPDTLEQAVMAYDDTAVPPASPVAEAPSPALTPADATPGDQAPPEIEEAQEVVQETVVEEEVQEDFFPRVEWTTEAQSPQLAGRAAEFIEYSNIILANQDFKGLKDIFAYFSTQYDLPPERMREIQNAILENTEQSLMESVAGVLSLKAEPSWRGHYQQALSKEALSAVVMQRFWSVKTIESELAGLISPESNSL